MRRIFGDSRTEEENRLEAERKSKEILYKAAEEVYKSTEKAHKNAISRQDRERAALRKLQSKRFTVKQATARNANDRKISSKKTEITTINESVSKLEKELKTKKTSMLKKKLVYQNAIVAKMDEALKRKPDSTKKENARNNANSSIVVIRKELESLDVVLDAGPDRMSVDGVERDEGMEAASAPESSTPSASTSVPVAATSAPLVTAIPAAKAAAPVDTPLAPAVTASLAATNVKSDSDNESTKAIHCDVEEDSDASSVLSTLPAKKTVAVVKDGKGNLGEEDKGTDAIYDLLKLRKRKSSRRIVKMVKKLAKEHVKKDEPASTCDGDSTELKEPAVAAPPAPSIPAPPDAPLTSVVAALPAPSIPAPPDAPLTSVVAALPVLTSAVAASPAPSIPAPADTSLTPAVAAPPAPSIPAPPDAPLTSAVAALPVPSIPAPADTSLTPAVAASPAPSIPIPVDTSLAPVVAAPTSSFPKAKTTTTKANTVAPGSKSRRKNNLVASQLPFKKPKRRVECRTVSGLNNSTIVVERSGDDRHTEDRRDLREETKAESVVVVSDGELSVRSSSSLVIRRPHVRGAVRFTRHSADAAREHTLSESDDESVLTNEDIPVYAEPSVGLSERLSWLKYKDIAMIVLFSASAAMGTFLGFPQIITAGRYLFALSLSILTGFVTTGFSLFYRRHRHELTSVIRGERHIEIVNIDESVAVAVADGLSERENNIDSLVLYFTCIEAFKIVHSALQRINYLVTELKVDFESDNGEKVDLDENDEEFVFQVLQNSNKKEGLPATIGYRSFGSGKATELDDGNFRPSDYYMPYRSLSASSDEVDNEDDLRKVQKPIRVITRTKAFSVS